MTISSLWARFRLEILERRISIHSRPLQPTCCCPVAATRPTAAAAVVVAGFRNDFGLVSLDSGVDELLSERASERASNQSVIGSASVNKFSGRFVTPSVKMRWLLLVSALVVALLAVVAQAQFGFRGGAFNGFFRSMNSGFRTMFHPVMNMFSPPSRPFSPNVPMTMQFMTLRPFLSSFTCNATSPIEPSFFLSLSSELQSK